MISIIICTRDRPELLRRCLESISRNGQAASQREVIVVDNAERPSAQVRRIAQEHTALYFWESHRGVSAARNRGILQASGTIVAFLDDDVTVDLGWQRAAVGHFARPEIMAVTGPVRASKPAGDMSSTWDSLYLTKHSQRTEFRASTPTRYVPLSARVCGLAANVAFRRSFFFRFGFFDACLGAGTLAPGSEETDRFFVALRKGGVILFEPLMACEHEFRGDAREFRRKVRGYAAGQSAYLAKQFVGDKECRPLVLQFVRDRARAFLCRDSISSGAGAERGRARAPRVAILVGTMWGPVGYSLLRIREMFVPNRSILLPLPAIPESDDGRPRVLMHVYNGGLTGMEKVAISTATALAGRTRVIIAFPAAGVAAARAVEAGLQVGFIPRWRLRATLNPGYQAAYLMALPGAIRAYIKAMRAVRPDILHIHSFLNLAPLLASRLEHRKAILHVHEIARGGLGAAIARLASACADRIIAVSGAVAARFSPHVREQKVITINAAVDVVQLRRTAAQYVDDEDRSVLFAGRLSQDKGPHLFLQSVALTCAKEPSARFVLCGITVPNRSAYEAQIQRAISQLHLADRDLRFYRDCESVEPFFAKCSIVVSASIDPDPFPLSILEGMALGKAVVVPNAGGLPEMVENEVTGLIYEAGNAIELSRCLIRLLRDPDLARRLGAAARTKVHCSYDVPSMAAAVWREYLGLLTPPGNSDDIRSSNVTRDMRRV